MKTVSIREIEKAISGRAAKNAPFAAAAIIADLDCRDDDALKERVERTLNSDEELFSRDGEYLRRAAYFNGRTFVITPSDLEIEENILFAGHRFVPYVHADIFPSEAKLTAKGAKKPFATREFQSELTAIFQCHMLLGSEQISDYLVADHPANTALNKMVKSNSKVTLNVFDMSEFYRKNDFCTGDALLCRIVDYDKGVFDCSYLSGEDRKESVIKEFSSRLGEAIGEVVDRFQGYLDLPEALSWAFFLGGDALFGAATGSLDEFLFFNEKVDITFDNGYTTFVRRRAESGAGHDDCGCGHEHGHGDDSDDELPDGVSVSGGAVDSMANLLKEIGANISVEEIDGYILDCCYTRELIYDDFFQRLFDRDKLNFTDEAQEAVFFNYLEERWEDLTGSYDRPGDEPRAELRRNLLELADLRRERFEELAELDADLTKAPEAPLKKLAELTIYSNDLLRLLNSEGAEIVGQDREKLEESLENLEDIQSAAFDEISKALNL